MMLARAGASKVVAFERITRMAACAAHIAAANGHGAAIEVVVGDSTDMESDAPPGERPGLLVSEVRPRALPACLPARFACFGFA
jgi:hypothetical protein